ncbi:MAG: PepSY domain-containing protein [Ornithinimicrobium sp.]
MKTDGKKIAIAAAALGGVLLAGGATIAAAAPDDSKSTGTSDEASFTGTITAPAEMPEGDETKEGSAEEKAQEEAETTALADLATVNEDQARTSATDAVPGTVGKIELDDEDGFVVWEAEITQADGTMVEVLIDAGDGRVLTQEVEDVDDEGDEFDDGGNGTGDTQAPGTDQQNDLEEATPGN